MMHFCGKLHTKIGLVIIPGIMNTFRAPHFKMHPKCFAMAMNKQETMTTTRSTIYIPTGANMIQILWHIFFFFFLSTFIYKVAEMDLKRHYFDRKVTFL